MLPHLIGIADMMQIVICMYQILLKKKIKKASSSFFTIVMTPSREKKRKRLQKDKLQDAHKLKIIKSFRTMTKLPAI